MSQSTVRKYWIEFSQYASPILATALDCLAWLIVGFGRALILGFTIIQWTILSPAVVVIALFVWIGMTWEWANKKVGRK